MKLFKWAIASKQLIVFFLVALGAGSCFFLGAPWWISGFLVFVVIAYLSFIFYTAANRQEGPLPELGHSILIFLCLFLTVLFAFGNMYLQSCEIVDTRATNNQKDSAEAVTFCGKSDILVNKTAAIYYSFITLSTTGYGEYLPTGTKSRLFVIYQLTAGVLLIAGGLAFLISRLASRGGSEVATSENLTEILKKRTFKLADNKTLVFVHPDNQKIDFLDTDEKWKELTDPKLLEEAKKKLNEQAT